MRQDTRAGDHKGHLGILLTVPLSPGLNHWKVFFRESLSGEIVLEPLGVTLWAEMSVARGS